MGLIVFDLFAGLMIIVGFHVGFRQDVARGLWTRFRPRTDDLVQREPSGGPSSEVDPLRSVFRMAGVMIMAFSVTSAAFANLIAHYAAAGPPS